MCGKGGGVSVDGDIGFCTLLECLENRVAFFWGGGVGDLCFIVIIRPEKNSGGATIEMRWGDLILRPFPF